MVNNMYEELQYLATFISILGGLFVMSHYVKTRLYGFYIWQISNGLWIIFGFLMGTTGLLITFCFYLITNTIGIYHNKNCKTVILTIERMDTLIMIVHDAQYNLEYVTREEIEKKLKLALCED